MIPHQKQNLNGAIGSTLGGIAAGATGLLLSLPAVAGDPYEKKDDSWISVAGEVVTTEEDQFALDFGEGIIIVEMDDWDWYQEGRALLPGQQVIVHGRVDDDLYEIRSIEASSVHVEGLNSTFFASAVDEEDVSTVYVGSYVSFPLVEGQEMSMTGMVTEIDGRELTLDTGVQAMQVDTGDMEYNPLDDEGYQKIDVGDWVSVSGALDLGFFEANEIRADRVVTLASEDRK